MSNASNYLEKAVLDHTLGTAAMTQPTVYVGLFTGSAAANLEAGVLTDEVSGGSYARKAATFAAASTATGSATTSADIEFDAATADWGTITHLAITDNATGGAGNVLYWGELDASKAIASGDTFVISAGNLTVTLA